MIPPHTNRYPKPPSGAATGWGRFFCVSDQGERAAAKQAGGAKDTWAVMARWRAGHARPLRTAVKIYAREGQGRAAARPLCSGRVVAREWMATQGPSESPSHLTVTALRARIPLSLRDISPHCGESPFDKGASLSPLRGFGGTPDSKVEEGAGASRTDSNTASV